MKRSVLKKGLFLTVALAMLVTFRNQAQDIESALSLTKSEQYEEAEEMLQEFIQNEPSNSSKYYFYLGENVLLEYFSFERRFLWFQLGQKSSQTGVLYYQKMILV